MKADGKTVHDILVNVPKDRVEAFNKLHDVIVINLPKGFEAAISYGGLGYVVPHTLYPAGYHCKPSDPLPFAGLASQKIQSIFITWVFIPILNYWIGSSVNIPNTVHKNWTWERAVSDLRSWKRFRINSLAN